MILRTADDETHDEYRADILSKLIERQSPEISDELLIRLVESTSEFVLHLHYV
jgi:hypothetical protein